MDLAGFLQKSATDLLDEMFDGVYILDQQRTIVFWNHGAERITGYSRQKMVGLPCHEGPLKHIDAQGCRLCEGLCPAGQAMEQAQEILEVIYLHAANGEAIPVETHIRSLRNASGEIMGAIEVFRDIRHWKKIEALSQEKDRLMGVLAHDIRNPLTVIQTFAVLLERNADAKLKEFVEPILRKVKLASALVDSLLDAQSIENGTIALNIQSVMVEEVLRESMANYAGAAREKEIRLELAVESPGIVLYSDALRLEEIFNNLISNAIHYSQRGAAVRLALRRYARGVEVEISDQGVGISQKDQEKLFRAFSQTTSRPTGGEASHGLGLYIVKRLMDIFAGHILVHSAPGRGTTFVLQFPEDGCPVPNQPA